MTRAASRISVYAPLQVLVYSSDKAMRTRIALALGHFPDASLAPVNYTEVATAPALFAEIDSGGVDLVILDAESTPYGGLGLAKQLKDEQLQCLPVVVITARPDDAWLARWSKADAVIRRPVDPIDLSNAVVPLLRRRIIA